MSRLCVRLTGAPEWRLVPFEPGDGWPALEAALLRAFSEDPRALAVANLAVVISDATPRLLARDCVGQLRDMDCVELELRRRDEAVPPLAMLMAAPFASPATPRPATRGVKREPSPPRDAPAAKAPSPFRDSSPTPVPAAAAEAVEEAAAEGEEVPPLRCFKVFERGRNRALLVGEKPSGRSGIVGKHLDYLAQRGVSTIISFVTPHARCVPRVAARAFAHRHALRDTRGRQLRGGGSPPRLHHRRRLRL